jgi:hypothetical protein
MPAITAAQELPRIRSSSLLVLDSQGSFYVGGIRRPVPSAEAFDIGVVSASTVVNQVCDQFEKPMKHNAVKLPIVLMHRCCLSAKSWEATPGGQMGCYKYFTRYRFDTKHTPCNRNDKFILTA